MASVTADLAWLGVVLTPYSWATHILLGLVIQLVAGLILQWCGVRNAWWIAAALSIGFWWGRKKIEYEFALKAAAHLQSVGRFWYLGWLPLEWPWPRQLDLYAPSAANILAALALNRRPPPSRSRP
jgi:hypothetical protein